MLLRKALLSVVIVSGCALFLLSCTPRPVSSGQAAAAPAGVAITAPAAKKAKEVQPTGPYAAEVKPLTTRECAACHLGIFNTIRESKQKHALECTFCHETYHTYRPGKKWSEVVPSCGTCHGKPHGDKMTACLDCHVNAHAPLNIAATPQLEKGCGTCHEPVAKDLLAHKSAHTTLECTACHSGKHGYIPSCLECHEPHVPNQSSADCLSCHPAHEPLVVKYPQNTPNATCAACHPKAQQQLTASQTKHSALACAKCHPVHKKILACGECHGQPHAAAMLKKFKTCGECHGAAHNMVRIGPAKK